MVSQTSSKTMRRPSRVSVKAICESMLAELTGKASQGRRGKMQRSRRMTSADVQARAGGADSFSLLSLFKNFIASVACGNYSARERAWAQAYGLASPGESVVGGLSERSLRPNRTRPSARHPRAGLRHQPLSLPLHQRSPLLQYARLHPGKADAVACTVAAAAGHALPLPLQRALLQ